MTFQPGQSGNPAGRPKGARGRTALLAEGMFEGEAEAIIRAAIDLAKAGDTAAVRVCLDRIAPRPRGRAINFELPPLHSAADAASALAAITAAVVAGELNPAEAGELFKLVDGFRQTLEATIFEERLTKVEREVGMLGSRRSQSNQIPKEGQNSQITHDPHSRHSDGPEP